MSSTTFAFSKARNFNKTMKQTTSQNPTGIQIFKNEMFGEIRTMTNEQGATFFVGKDVARALGYSNTRKALQDHVDAEDRGDGATIRDSIGRDQRAVIINESGLYSLILSSQLPSAKAFKRWVTSEVLPQIRRQGGYLSAKAQAAPLIDLRGSKGSQASIVVIMGADGTALRLTPEMLARLIASDGRVLPALTEYRPYHSPVRELVARTAFGIVREGSDDYTLYMRAPKAYMKALGMSKETFFEAEFKKLMVQCVMSDE